MMLKHIVMWRFIDGANGQSKQQHAQWMKEHLENLVGKVPELISAEVGVNVNLSDAAYDAVLIALFKNEEDLNTYKVHPLHVAISEHCKTVRETRVACDYYVD